MNSSVDAALARFGAAARASSPLTSRTPAPRWKRRPLRQDVLRAAAAVTAIALGAVTITWSGSASTRVIEPKTWQLLDASASPVDPPYTDDAGVEDADASEWSCDACARTSN